MSELSRTPSIEEGLYEREEFLRMAGDKLGWKDLHGHVVMDVGCGDGKSTFSIMELFPRVRHIVGIDYDKEKVEEAKMANPHQYIEYRYADIEKRHTICRWENQITKVVSIYCLQQSRDQKTAFRHIHSLLMENGEAAILFSIQSGFYDWFAEITSHPKWKAYTEGISTQNPESHVYKLGSNYYQELFEEVGFTVILCQEDRSTYSYSNDDQLKAAIIASCAMTSNIPEDLRDEFHEALFQVILKHNRRDNLGRPTVLNINLVAILKKVYQVHLQSTEV